MATTSKQGPARQEEADQTDRDRFCWKELLDHAFNSLEASEQTLERIIDRVGRTS